MIKDKHDLRYYMKADEIALNIPQSGSRRLMAKLVNRIWKFERLLRKAEYHTNVGSSFFRRQLGSFARFRAYHYGGKIGYEIPVNVFGPGLSIAHKGLIIINPHTKIGNNCRIHNCVHIGTEGGYNDRCPLMGDNIFIGPGASIFGKIEIADGIAIGANSVVNKSFLEKDISIAGIPAGKISDKGSRYVYHRPTETLNQWIASGKVKI